MSEKMQTRPDGATAQRPERFIAFMKESFGPGMTDDDVRDFLGRFLGQCPGLTNLAKPSSAH